MLKGTSTSEAVVVETPARIGRTAIGALGVLALALGALQSVVEPALPLLQRELGVSPGEGALIGNVLLITGAVVTPVAGKLGDRYGGKRVLIWLMAVVSAGGLLAGLAPNLPVLLLGQVLQGVMVGALPLSFILVRKHLSPGESQVAIGLVVALFTGGGMVGFLFAGPISEGLSWHWMFALPTIVIIATTAVVSRLMPHDPPIQSDSGIDWPGVVLLSGTLLAFMLGLVTVTRDGGLPPLAVGAIAVTVTALAAGWIAVERRAASPMVDLRMLAKPAMWHACVLTLVITTSSGMVLLLLPQLFAVSADGYGFGAGTTAIGLFLLPGAIVGAASDSVGGIAARRFGPRAVVVVGTVVTAATMIALASLHSAEWQLVLAKVLTAFAAGVATTALLAGTATAVETKDTGIATSLLVVTRVIGVALGAQIGGAILDAGADPVTGLPTKSAFATGFAVAGLVAALSLLVVRFMKKGAQA
ncbi:integral membrane protein [Streptomyces lincolnensis]|uniref:Integral membrane protein n=1 Tax=Streptomyces lincolnensis TaxID=1915 RepID=A0A1B1M377_STRLN|nr:integral membrane protein [Streptomyces lincolnensis]AXG52045.1 integral membrane protein [Streptomyces lincolnensis]QMV05033.1 MFS transporter [Streptomyces lincolnensis]